MEKGRYFYMVVMKATKTIIENHRQNCLNNKDDKRYTYLLDVLDQIEEAIQVDLKNEKCHKEN